MSLYQIQNSHVARTQMSVWQIQNNHVTRVSHIAGMSHVFPHSDVTLVKHYVTLMSHIVIQYVRRLCPVRDKTLSFITRRMQRHVL